MTIETPSAFLERYDEAVLDDLRSLLAQPSISATGEGSTTARHWSGNPASSTGSTKRRSSRRRDDRPSSPRVRRWRSERGRINRVALRSLRCPAGNRHGMGIAAVRTDPARRARRRGAPSTRAVPGTTRDSGSRTSVRFARAP